MAGGRTWTGVLATIALSFVVGGIWLLAQPDDDGAGGPAVGDRSADAPVADAPARPARRRAHVRTDEDVRRDEARERLADEVAAASSSAGAANVRRMALPGAESATPPDWTPAKVRLTAAQPHAAAVSLVAKPAASTTAPARPGFYVRSSPDEGIRPWDSVGYLGDYAPMSGDAERSGDPVRHGLRADIYDFLDGELTEVPDLAALPPSLTRVDPLLDFDTDESFALPFEPDTFGVLWRGFLRIEQAGEYEFTAGSDDGVRVRIDGRDVLEFSWLRPYAESEGRIELEAGRHAIEVAFYENYGFASCRLFWRPPGATVRSIVPALAFEPPDEVAAADPPRVRSIDPLHARLGDEVEIEGSGFSAVAALDRVTFAGVPAEIVSASPDLLVVKVPVGASSGPLVVQVGPISTRPVRFEVDTLVGLYGEYHLIGTELSEMPAFDAIAPYFVRLDGPIDFSEDDLWRMPYDPDVFAVRWTGFLYAPADDEYEITLGSDDGAALRLSGADVVALPGLHPYEEAAEVVALTKGFHPLELTFFENYGGANCRLFWRRRGEPSRETIPRGFLFAPDALANRTEPRIASIEPATALAGDEVLVHGAGFGDDLRYVRVEFPGGAWKRPEFVADDLLRLRVPYGAGSGPVRVHVGIRTSDPANFTLAEPTGLLGEYFDLGSEDVASAALLPDLLANRTPTLTRIDSRFRFGRREDWALPFAPGRFAVRWSGTIAVETAQNLLVALQSESAALLRIDGGDVVADTDPHTLRESYGQGRLTPGEHRIELWSLHLGGDPRLHVFVTPVGRLDHLEVEPASLRPRAPR